MKKSEKLYNCFGSLRDEWIDDAINANKNNSATNSKKVMPMRNLLIVAIVSILCCSLTVACFANAEGISEAVKSFFSREEELIDPYAAIIYESTETDEVSVTVNKIVRDGDDYIFFIHLHSPLGFEPGHLFYETITIEQETTEGWKERYDIIGGRIKNPANTLLAGLELDNLKTKTQDLDVFISVSADSPVFEDEYENLKTNNFRLSVHNLFTIQIIDDGHGTPKCLDPYFEELTVEFEFDESKAEMLPEKKSHPNTEFVVEGTKFVLTEMIYSPLHLTLVVEDPGCEIFEVDGLHFYGTSKLNYYQFCEEYPPVEPISTEDSMAFSNFKAEHGLYNGHSLYVETSVGENNRGYVLQQAMENGGYNMNKVIFIYRFAKPVYENEIKEVGFMQYIYDDYPVTPDTEYTIEKVVAWENPDYNAADE